MPHLLFSWIFQVRWWWFCLKFHRPKAQGKRLGREEVRKRGNGHSVRSQRCLVWTCLLVLQSNTFEPSTEQGTLMPLASCSMTVFCIFLPYIFTRKVYLLSAVLQTEDLRQGLEKWLTACLSEAFARCHGFSTMISTALEVESRHPMAWVSDQPGKPGNEERSRVKTVRKRRWRCGLWEKMKQLWHKQRKLQVWNFKNSTQHFCCSR